MKYRRLCDVGIKRSTRVIRDDLEALGLNLARNYGSRHCWIICNKDWEFIVAFNSLAEVKEFTSRMNTNLQQTDEQVRREKRAYDRWVNDPGRGIF